MPLPGAPLLRNVRRENSGGFQQLAGAPAVLALAREHGLSARTAKEAVTAAVAAAQDGDNTVLSVLAHRLATGLAAIVAVVDPQLVLLSGDIPLAGGEELRSLVQEELTGLAVPRPQLALSTVPGSPVVVGATLAALATARESVFSTY